MPTFVWGEEFHTGIGFVDEQHHALIDLFNQLSASFTERGVESEVAMQRVFAQLIDYARYHFSLEEELMRKEGVDRRHVALHVRLHDEFAEQVQGDLGRAQVARQPGGSLPELPDFMALPARARRRPVAGAPDRADQGRQYGGGCVRAGAIAAARKSSLAMIKALRNTYQTVSRLSLELITANRFLEQRVVARTQELQEATEALRLANQKLRNPFANRRPARHRQPQVFRYTP